MSKTRDTGFINNILKYDNDGNVSVVSGSTTLLFISSSGAIITTGIISGSNALSASYAVSASNTLAAQTASYVLSAQSASYVLNAQSASYVLNAQSASFVANAQSASNAVAAQTASYILNAVSSSFASTASSADDLLVRGTLTAQTLVVQTITSSVSTITGSTNFGSTGSNTHQFTGSVSIIGNITSNSTNGISGTFRSNTFFGSIDLENTGGDIAGKWNVQSVSGTQIGGSAGSSFGIYSYGASAYRLWINNSGSVGIGTLNPSVKLDVVGDQIIRDSSTATTYISINASSDVPRFELYNNGTGSMTMGYRGASAPGTQSIGEVRVQLNSPLLFSTNNTERIRITSDGNLLVGTTSLRVTGYTTGNSQYAMENTGYGGAQWFTNRNDNEGTYIVLGKSRGTTVNSNTVVANNDILGGIIFQGTDGTNSETAAYIRASVDGTPGNNDMPGRLEFLTTADGSVSPTERMRITNAGNVGIGTTSPTSLLEASLSQNAQTGIRVRNSTAGTGASVEFGAYTDSGNGGFGKYSTATNPYKNIVAASTFVYNGSSGDIALLNDVPSGNISFAAGGVSTAQMFISGSGRVGVGTITPSSLLNVHTARSSGANVDVLTLSDNVTGVQTSGFGVRILATSNNGQAKAAIAFEADGGTNNDTAIAFYTQTSAAAMPQRLIIDKNGTVRVNTSISSTNYKFGVSGSAYINGTNNRGVFITDGASYASIVGLNNAISSYNSLELRASGVDGQLYLSSGGNVGFFTTAPTGSVSSNLVHVNGPSAVFRVGPTYPATGAGTDRDYIELLADGANTRLISPNETFSILNPGGGAGSWAIDIVAGSGGVRLTNGATSWSSISDIRQKDIIEPITDALSKVSTLSTVIYKFKDDETEQRRVGLIAQEVNEVLPEAVNSFEDEEKMWSVRYTELIPLLTKAIQEQQAQIEELKAIING